MITSESRVKEIFHIYTRNLKFVLKNNTQLAKERMGGSEHEIESRRSRLRESAELLRIFLC